MKASLTAVIGEIENVRIKNVKVCYLLESEISSTFWILDAVIRLIVDPDGSSKSIQMKISPIIEIKFSKVLPHNF